MSSNKMELSLKDRLFLSNQYRVLEAICPDEADDFRRMRGIVDNGYELHYDSLNYVLFENGPTVEDCKEAMDILDMYRALLFSFRKLKEKEGVSQADVQFKGFDGKIRDYARFLIREEHRWEEVLEGRPEFDLDSHCSINEVYRRMLAEWKNVDRRAELSLQEIKQILGAQIHPEYRK